MLPCTFYSAGKCRAGHKCKYSHESKASDSKKSVSVPLPCKFFKENACKAGDACRFSHEIGLKMPKGSTVDVVCKYFAEGWCSEANHCPFIHDRQRAVQEKKKAQEEKRQVERQKIEEKKKQMYQFCSEVSNVKVSVLSISEDAKPVASLNKIPPPQQVEHQETKETKEEEEEEEAFFYGAPGAFQVEHQQPQQPSYTKVAIANVPENILQAAAAAAALPLQSRKVCAFFQQGSCRYGAACRHYHATKTATDDSAFIVEKELKESTEIECCICYEVVLSKPGERFGLLSGCMHAFCLSCVRNWRGMTDEQSKENVSTHRAFEVEANGY